METDPFDKELETDMIVPCDVVPVPVDITRIASEEEFKRQVTKLSPDELAFLLAQMLDDKKETDPDSQKINYCP